jgi:hypothetical protein
MNIKKLQGLDMRKMLSDICELVENDFCTSMEMNLLPGSPEYTQKEAKSMAEIIASVYSIAHSIHCSGCGGKYIKTKK